MHEDSTTSSLYITLISVTMITFCKHDFLTSTIWLGISVYWLYSPCYMFRSIFQLAGTTREHTPRSLSLTYVQDFKIKTLIFMVIICKSLHFQIDSGNLMLLKMKIYTVNICNDLCVLKNQTNYWQDCVRLHWHAYTICSSCSYTHQIKLLWIID